MDKIKEFYTKNKKIVIPAAIILVLLIAVGIYFISQPNDNANQKTENQTEEKIDISQDDKKEDDKTQDDAKADESPAETLAEQSNDSSADKTFNDKPESSNAGNSGNSGSSNSSIGSSNNGNSSSSKSSAPSHTHSWKDHTATKQVWVSKIVPVYKEEPVYEDRPVYKWVAYYECRKCGFQTEDPDVMDMHCLECGGTYTTKKKKVQTGTEKVQVGTNKVQVGTRDDGYYKNETYVDYEYCDCGAKK